MQYYICDSVNKLSQSYVEARASLQGVMEIHIVNTGLFFSSYSHSLPSLFSFLLVDEICLLTPNQ